MGICGYMWIGISAYYCNLVDDGRIMWEYIYRLWWDSIMRYREAPYGTMTYHDILQQLPTSSNMLQLCAAIFQIAWLSKLLCDTVWICAAMSGQRRESRARSRSPPPTDRNRPESEALQLGKRRLICCWMCFLICLILFECVWTGVDICLDIFVPNRLIIFVCYCLILLVLC